jgi:uncharacterized protein
MQHEIDNDAMEEVLAAVRRRISEDLEPGTRPSGVAKRSPENEAGARPVSEDGLLSREASTIIGSAISRLTEDVKNRQPSLEDVVRDALRPMLKSWLDKNLPDLVDRIVQLEIEKAIRGR